MDICDALTKVAHSKYRSDEKWQVEDLDSDGMETIYHAKQSANYSPLNFRYTI